MYLLMHQSVPSVALWVYQLLCVPQSKDRELKASDYSDFIRDSLQDCNGHFHAELLRTLSYRPISAVQRQKDQPVSSEWTCHCVHDLQLLLCSLSSL